MGFHGVAVVDSLGSPWQNPDSASYADDTIHGLLSRGLRSLNGDDKRVVQEHVTYITNNKDRMRYSTLRQAGLPLGSGVTESTAKNVVNRRAKRSGQRWSVADLRGVLSLRALLKSERLAQFWTAFSHRYTATVNSLPAAACSVRGPHPLKKSADARVELTVENGRATSLKPKKAESKIETREGTARGRAARPMMLTSIHSIGAWSCSSSNG